MSGCDLRDLGLDHVDFLSNDEDLILSQACEEIEMNYCFGEIKLQDYDMDLDADFGNLMNFDLSFETQAIISLGFVFTIYR
jgi:hypothetical protein